MSILEVKHLSHGFGERTIFEDVSFRLLKGEHIGLVGANGEGKSTFMSIVTGHLQPDEGKVEWSKYVTAGYLDQHTVLEAGMTVRDVLRTAFDELFKTEERINAMPEEEKQEFVNTMTNSERNSVIKQLSASDKAAIISNFMDVGKEFGITFNIDEISGDNLVVSAVDENGKLINVTSMSVTVDPTGYSYTMPVVISGGMLLLSAGGIALITRKKKNKA